MTQNAVTKCASATLFLLVLLLLLALLSDAAYQFDQNQNLKETNIEFYMHDWQSGLKATAIPVGGSQNKPWSAVEFGTIYTIDDKLTVTSDPNSAQLGRAQGIYVNSAQDSNDPALQYLLFSVVFTNKEFNGSTLEIQGTDKLFERQRGFCGVWN